MFSTQPERHDSMQALYIILPFFSHFSSHKASSAPNIPARTPTPPCATAPAAAAPVLTEADALEPEPEAALAAVPEAPAELLPMSVALALALAMLLARLVAAETADETEASLDMEAEAEAAVSVEVMTGPGPMGMVLEPVVIIDAVSVLAAMEEAGADVEPAAPVPEPVAVTGGRERLTPLAAQACWANWRASAMELVPCSENK